MVFYAEFPKGGAVLPCPAMDSYESAERFFRFSCICGIFMQKEGNAMRLLFKQRFFSWFDSYDIYDEAGNTLFVVKGELAWGHLLRIYDAHGNEVGYIREKILTWLPKFEMYVGNNCVGSISKEFTFFRPRYNIDCRGWQVEGNWLEWDYDIRDSFGQTVAAVNKELFNWTDTYVIDVRNPQDALYALMLVLAIDAEKCSRKD
jgi:uncharacterized protein YxjI